MSMKDKSPSTPGYPQKLGGSSKAMSKVTQHKYEDQIGHHLVGSSDMGSATSANTARQEYAHGLPRTTTTIETQSYSDQASTKSA